MVKRTNKSAAKSNENEALTAKENISQIPSKQHDDLIIALADAYENKRERQVSEWENLGRQKLYQQRAA